MFSEFTSSLELLRTLRKYKVGSSVFASLAFIVTKA
jgi:hypothetical protein